MLWRFVHELWTLYIAWTFTVEIFILWSCITLNYVPRTLMVKQVYFKHGYFMCELLNCVSWTLWIISQQCFMDSHEWLCAMNFKDNNLNMNFLCVILNCVSWTCVPTTWASTLTSEQCFNVILIMNIIVLKSAILTWKMWKESRMLKPELK